MPTRYIKTRDSRFQHQTTSSDRKPQYLSRKLRQDAETRIMSSTRETFAAALALFALATVLGSAGACMCMPNHPQESICRNDSFVALVRIKGEVMVRLSVQQHEEKQQNRHKKSADKPAAMILTVKGRTKHDKKTEDPDTDDFVPTARPGEVVVNDVSGGEGRSESLVRYRMKVHKAYKGFSTAGSNKQKLYVYSTPDEGLCGRRLSPRETYLIIGSIIDGRLRVDLCNTVIPWKSLPKAEKRNVRRNMEQISTVCASQCKVNYCRWNNCKPKDMNECAWNKSMERKYGSVHQANFMCVPNARGRCAWQRSAGAGKPSKRTRRHHDGLRRRHTPEMP